MITSRVEIAHVDDAEVMHHLKNGMKLVVAIVLPHGLVQLRGPPQRPKVQIHQFAGRQRMPFGVEPAQVAEQESRRVAQPPVGLRYSCKDVGGNAHFAPVVGGQYPQAQDVRPELVGHFPRVHDIAQRLGLLASLLIHREAMGQDRVIRRPAVHGHGGQQR